MKLLDHRVEDGGARDHLCVGEHAFLREEARLVGGSGVVGGAGGRHEQLGARLVDRSLGQCEDGRDADADDDAHDDDDPLAPEYTEIGAQLHLEVRFHHG